ADQTHHGTVLGTPGYMAPEIWRGEPSSFRSDVYSLGALLYFLCAGRPPHQGKDLLEFRAAALEQEFKPLGTVSDVDPRIAAIIHRCLSRDPKLRFASGEEVRDALEALLPEQPGRVLPEGNPYRGLLAFQAEHRALFFGRDAEIRTILERLRNEG